MAQSVQQAFCAESFEYMKAKPALSTKEAGLFRRKLSTARKRVAGVISSGLMNMILHGIEAPNILHTNTLAENLSDIPERDRYNVVLANRLLWRNAPRCSRTSRSKRARRRFCFYSTSSRF